MSNYELIKTSTHDVEIHFERLKTSDMYVFILQIEGSCRDCKYNELIELDEKFNSHEIPSNLKVKGKGRIRKNHAVFTEQKF